MNVNRPCRACKLTYAALGCRSLCRPCFDDPANLKLRQATRPPKVPNALRRKWRKKPKPAPAPRGETLEELEALIESRRGTMPKDQPEAGCGRHAKRRPGIRIVPDPRKGWRP